MENKKSGKIKIPSDEEIENMCKDYMNDPCDIINNDNKKPDDAFEDGYFAGFKTGLDYIYRIGHNWTNVKDGLPKFKTYFDKEWHNNVTEVSITVIVSDGEDSWAESYSEAFGFNESIIEWMYLPEPSKKQIK